MAVIKASANLLAFLDMLAVSEGTAAGIHPTTRNDGYDVIVTGVDKKPEIFSDYSTHPFSRGRPSKQITTKGLTSNASGRYQHMLKDWEHYRKQLNLPDFSPLSQDTWAIQLIRERRALPDIEAGRFVEAVTKVCNIWASLPGAGYGQPEHNIAKLASAYTRAGGTIV